MWVIFRQTLILAYCVALSNVSQASAQQLLIVDHSSTPTHSIARIEQISDPAFKVFAEDLLTGLRERFGDIEPKSVELSEVWQEGLAFLRIPLSETGRPPNIVVQLSLYEANEGCVVSSPWSDLAIQFDPEPKISGVFFWSERQILLDQLSLAGMTSQGISPKRSLDMTEFKESANEYAQKVIVEKTHSISDFANEVTDLPELLWLFRNSTQSTIIPFAGLVGQYLRKISMGVASAYSDINLELVDRCLAGKIDDVRYTSIMQIEKIPRSILAISGPQN